MRLATNYELLGEYPDVITLLLVILTTGRQHIDYSVTMSLVFYY